MTGLRYLAAGVAVNATMGLLYIWSIFLFPLQAALKLDIAALSLVSSLALVAFTAGMLLHDAILRRVSTVMLVVGTYAVAGGGYLLFGYAPGYASLLAGYGVCFGFAAGVGYGVALAAAGQLSARWRHFGVGLAVATFAVSGMVLAKLLPGLMAHAGVAGCFRDIGWAVCGVGVAVAALLGRLRLWQAEPSGGMVRMPRPGQLAMLTYFCFVLSYPGLMWVAHATDIWRASGVADAALSWGPFLFNGGYVLGSLSGSSLVAMLGGKRMLMASFLVFAAVFLAVFAVGGAAAAVVGTFVIGAVFGGSASLQPALIAERFGAQSVGAVYGKVSVGYGAAGLLAPWVTAMLDAGLGMRAALLVAAGLSATGIGLALFEAFDVPQGGEELHPE